MCVKLIHNNTPAVLQNCKPIIIIAVHIHVFVRKVNIVFCKNLTDYNVDKRYFHSICPVSLQGMDE